MEFNTQAQVLPLAPPFPSEESHNRNNPSRPRLSYTVDGVYVDRRDISNMLLSSRKKCHSSYSDAFYADGGFDYCYVTEEKSTDGFCVTSSD